MPDEFNDIDGSKLPDERWYGPQMEIELTEKYIAKLKTYEYIYKDDKKDSLQDLEDMLAILKIFERKSLKWHLTIDI